MTQTPEPTLRDVLTAITRVETSLGRVETRLDAVFSDMSFRFNDVTTRLNTLHDAIADLRRTHDNHVHPHRHGPDGEVAA